jgi:hypothetical protein
MSDCPPRKNLRPADRHRARYGREADEDGPLPRRPWLLQTEKDRPMRKLIFIALLFTATAAGRDLISPHRQGAMR